MAETTDPRPPDEGRSIARELKRGSLELIVLHLLSGGEAYGYEIVSKLTADTNGVLEVTDGTLYPVLYRLERAGFVQVRWETPAAPRPGRRQPANRLKRGKTTRRSSSAGCSGVKARWPRCCGWRHPARSSPTTSTATTKNA